MVTWPKAGTYRKLGYVIPDELYDGEPVNLTQWHFEGWKLVHTPVTEWVPPPPTRPKLKVRQLVVSRGKTRR